VHNSNADKHRSYRQSRTPDEQKRKDADRVAEKLKKKAGGACPAGSRTIPEVFAADPKKTTPGKGGKKNFSFFFCLKWLQLMQICREKI
jgi:hypothetical protein